jgi:FkbM family methyltransferase
MFTLLHAIVAPGLRQRLELARVRGRIRRARVQHISLGGYEVQFADKDSLYAEYKDIFIHRIYDAACTGSDTPLIIDGGACIGMSVLRFKQQHPRARIIAFEPDPGIRAILQHNITANRLEQVRIEPAGLSDLDGELRFTADGSDGGRIDAHGAGTIPVRRLSTYLDQGADLVKLNIEGQELPVLEELVRSDRLRSVGQFIIEYHGWAGQTPVLARLLGIFETHGFDYMIHDFDGITNPVSKPPFKHPHTAPWFCLVSAVRR